MRGAAAAVVVLAAALTLPAAAHAQEESCPAPKVTAFVLPPDPPRARSVTRISVDSAGASRVEVQWPEGDTSSKATRRDTVAFERVFARAGKARILATAVAPCGARSAPAALRLTVRPACRDTRDDSVYEESCDRERARLTVGSAGVTTRATSTAFTCRDVIRNPRVIRVGGGAPTARAASCGVIPGPARVAGRLDVERGRRLTLTFAVPVDRVRVLLGDPDRGTARLSGVRGRGRRWTVRIPRTASVAHSRVWVSAQPGAFVAGIRLR